MIEITTEVGRVVGGHPMIGNAVKDDNGLPQMQKDRVTPQVDYYVGLAIPKNGIADWRQTRWGQLMVQEAMTAWPNGQHGAPTFAWKITDGDSQVPNKKGNKPCDQEGYPGHWIINASNGFPIRCYHRGRYAPEQQIQRKEEIKKGDYGRLVIQVKGNGSDNPSPGMYINPTMFELYQAGVEIISASAPDPMATFGAVEGVLPAGALIDPNITAPAGAPPPVTQAPPPVTQAPPPAQTRMMTTKAGGVPYEAFIAQGWTDDVLIEQGYMVLTQYGVTPSTAVLGG